MQRGAARLALIKVSAASKAGTPERSLRENNQQATGGHLRESKLKLMDYSPGHLNRSKSFFTPVAQSYLLSLCNLIPSYFPARWLAAPEEVGPVGAYLARQERSFIGDRARFA